MQDRAGNRSPGKLNRVEHRNRSQCAGSADIYLDFVEGGLFLLGGILERHRPLRHLRRKSDLVSHGEIVDLYDRAVDVKREAPAHFAYLPDTLDNLVCRVDYPVIGNDREAQALHVFERFGVAGKLLPAKLLKIEHENIKLPLCSDRAVLLA